MSTIKPVFLRSIVSCIVAGIVASPGYGPWTSAAAQGLATVNNEGKSLVDQKEKFGFGRFVSFEDGTLIIESNSGSLLFWSNIAENTPTLKYDPDSNDYQPVARALAALERVKAGTYMMVGNGRAFIRIGARHDQVIGTFISFKNERLLTLGKELPESFTKRYGNNLLYNKFRDDVPVYESVDGGEFKLIGTANKVLLEVKEGTVLNVHGEGDDNITRIEIGTPKKVQSGGGRGKFISFEEGSLTIEANDGTLIQNKLPESTKTFRWNDDGGFKLVETVATLEKVKAGAWIHIQLEKGTATVRIGSRKGVTIGTFVSYKNNRLLLLSKNLGESFVKKYGNQVHFNKFRDDVQAYESVDGGDYQLLGFANKELANVKEGTVITVHGEGDDNITLVQIGVPTEKADKALEASSDKPADKAPDESSVKTPDKTPDKTPR